MKRIILLLLLCIACFGYGQDKMDFLGRTSGTLRQTKWRTYAAKDDSLNVSFLKFKNFALKPIELNFTEDQQKIADSLFLEQYPVLVSTVDHYKESKSVASKVELIKLLVKNEEDFRAILSKDQIVKYVLYGQNHSHTYTGEFFNNFMSDKQLQGYKKELK